MTITGIAAVACTVVFEIRQIKKLKAALAEAEAATAEEAEFEEEASDSDLPTDE